jgi:hypothetical protein
VEEEGGLVGGRVAWEVEGKRKERTCELEQDWGGAAIGGLEEDEEGCVRGDWGPAARVWLFVSPRQVGAGQQVDVKWTPANASGNHTPPSDHWPPLRTRPTVSHLRAVSIGVSRNAVAHNKIKRCRLEG